MECTTTNGEKHEPETVKVPVWPRSDLLFGVIFPLKESKSLLGPTSTHIAFWTPVVPISRTHYPMLSSTESRDSNSCFGKVNELWLLPCRAVRAEEGYPSTFNTCLTLSLPAWVRSKWGKEGVKRMQHLLFNQSTLSHKIIVCAALFSQFQF